MIITILEKVKRHRTLRWGEGTKAWHTDESYDAENQVGAELTGKRYPVSTKFKLVVSVVTVRIGGERG